jgi:hypothetical protein
VTLQIARVKALDSKAIAVAGHNVSTEKKVAKGSQITKVNPRTEQGRKRCTEAKTIHDIETHKARTERAEGMRRFLILEDLGHALGILSGQKTPGRKACL